MSSTAIIAVDLLLEFLMRASEISLLIKQAKAEGREITAAELDAVAGRADVARQRLVDAIAKARGN